MIPGKLREGRSLAHREENARLIKEFLEDLEVRGRSPHTITAYRYSLTDFFDFTLGLSVADITHNEIREWLHFLRVRKVSAETIGQRLYAVRSFFEYAKQVELVKRSPADLIANDARRGRRRLPKWLSANDVQKLIAAAENVRDAGLVMFMFDTGCRISEVVGTRIEDINWGESVVKVLGKGDKERLVAFGQKTADALREYLRARESGPLFRQERAAQRGGVWKDRSGTWFGQWRENDADGRRVMRTLRLGDYEITSVNRAREVLNTLLAGKLPASQQATTPLDPRSIRRILDEMGKKAGLGHVNPHALRHSFATAMLEGGADLRAIQELLGHANIQTTQLYTHCTMNHLRSQLHKAHPSWQEDRNEVE